MSIRLSRYSWPFTRKVFTNAKTNNIDNSKHGSAGIKYFSSIKTESLIIWRGIAKYILKNCSLTWIILVGQNSVELVYLSNASIIRVYCILTVLYCWIIWIDKLALNKLNGQGWLSWNRNILHIEHNYTWRLCPLQ